MDKICIYEFLNQAEEINFLGPINKNLKLLETIFSTTIIHQNSALYLTEYDEELKNNLNAVVSLFSKLQEKSITITERDIVYITNYLKKSNFSESNFAEIVSFYDNNNPVVYTFDSRRIQARTVVQRMFVKAMDDNSIVFATGAAGSGKTFLAVAYAVGQLKKNLIKRIIITRPAVEAGEKLGFLPGDLKEKVDPYLIPIYDSLNDILGQETVTKLVTKGVIDIAPLAYMRGRTLDNAIIILDEAQNTTSSQMKMFITRLGFSSKMIITGDITQIDLPSQKQSGLIEATKILENIKGIKHIKFSTNDVMRHPLVAKIIDRYEEYEDDKV